MKLTDLDRVIEAADGCEQNLRLIHSACGAVPKDAPMPSMSTFMAWKSISDALTLLRKMREKAVEGWVGEGPTGTEFAADDGTFTPGPSSVPALLITPEAE